MTLPASFNQYTTTVIKPKFRRLVIASQGNDNTGKSEFILSMPGPGICSCIDMGYEGMMQNPNPPATRGDGIYMLPYEILHNKEATTQDVYKEAWRLFRNHSLNLLKNTDSITQAIDSGTDAYNSLRLAVYGRLEQIPSMQYVESDALWKSFLDKHNNSGKNIIMTHKMKDEYVNKVDPFGNVVMRADGTGPEKVSSGKRIRQGFRDHDYMFTIQLEHMFRPAETEVIEKGPRAGKIRTIAPMDWGIKILRCKINRGLEGCELWGSDCNFQGLVKFIYPNVPLSQWGY